ncbi:MAG: serine/threonine protein kinase [Pontiellaceae bacterium]|nr:serine/threonine protein kinase [Pontiellaceae bacterium]MBN2785863.1 serine/threonine protein kinase [Pontiellaceae bacterium]
MSQHRDSDSESIKAQSDEILCEALGIDDEAERSAFVEQACGDLDAVKDRVNRLLSFQNRAERIFDAGSPATISATEVVSTLSDIPEFFDKMRSALPDDGEVGRQIGPYKLLQKIGEGGAGDVYLAEQIKPVRRQVALKIIKAGMDTQSVIARFEAERQALAMMDHPNIAHVFNAGETETGRPYFVMELVSGERITRYCDDHGLSIHERLKLFVRVCQAIQHAHQKGIVHRDIKPSNVLIASHDGMPRPVVIDFGIAKATQGDALTDKTIHTSVEHWMGTPAYMSPEQVDCRHSDIDTRSDVYSLGVLLYELLVGESPFNQQDLLREGLEEMRRILLERDPQKPSSRLLHLSDDERRRIAEERATEPRRLVAELGGDLDWIVLKALEKDRTRRYETVDALAMDVEHYLHVEPVVARPPSRVYRIRKLMRRNKVATFSVFAVSLSLIFGLGVSSWLLVRERVARRQAVEATQKALEAQHAAEQAEQRQALLRIKAEDRERIAMAAFYISQGRKEDAYREADQISTELSPSLETEHVLRTVGEWLALRGEFEASSKYFNRLLDVDVKDNSYNITGDFLMAGPVLLKTGNQAAYDAFRRIAIERCKGMQNPASVERVIKIALLIPGDDEMMQRLLPFARLAAKATLDPDENDGAATWRCVSLALWAYRNGDAAESEIWARKSLGFSTRNELRDATASIILSMACRQQGEIPAGRVALERGRDIVKARTVDGLTWGSPAQGLWFDVLFAEFLLNEADTLYADAG